MTCAYRLLAIDLDGTLFDPTGKVSAANRQAVDLARDAGLHVVICTGRGLAEARDAVAAIGQTDPMIVAGGAMCADPTTGRTLFRSVIDPMLVRDVAHVLIQLGHRVLLLKDRPAVGYDYLVVGDGRIHPATTAWFHHLGVVTREIALPEHDEHPEHTIRIGIVTSPDDMKGIAARLRERFGDRAMIQHFPAVSENASGGLDSTIDILEVFDPQVNKWNGIAWYAGQLGLDESQVAAIGDEINDLEMIRRAGLGIAMENAVPAVRDAADRITASNEQDGVALAIQRILSGTW
ncbi:MAG: HAD family phosphatase [Phycisphaerales bacterium]|nr:HAD family phosphatase [Phycisphaerales bacterium]